MKRKILVASILALALGVGVVVFGPALAQPLWQTADQSSSSEPGLGSCHVETDQDGSTLGSVTNARALPDGALQEHLEQLVAEGHLSQADADAMGKHMGQVGGGHMPGMVGGASHTDMMKGMTGDWHEDTMKDTRGVGHGDMMTGLGGATHGSMMNGVTGQAYEGMMAGHHSTFMNSHGGSCHDDAPNQAQSL